MPRIPGWIGVPLLVLLLLAVGGASALPSSQRSGSVQGWGAMAIQGVDCDKGNLALVFQDNPLPNAQNPELWEVVVIAELKDSVITRESQGSHQLVCTDLAPLQVVNLTGKVTKSERGPLLVSAWAVRIDHENVFDRHQKTVGVTAFIKEVDKDFIVIDGGLKIPFRHPVVIWQRNKQGVWVEEPLLQQLQPDMRVFISIATRPDVKGVFTEKIAITN